jgi:hypothetical protein
MGKTLAINTIILFNEWGCNFSYSNVATMVSTMIKYSWLIFTDKDIVNNADVKYKNKIFVVFDRDGSSPVKTAHLFCVFRSQLVCCQVEVSASD